VNCFHEPPRVGLRKRGPAVSSKKMHRSSMPIDADTARSQQLVSYVPHTS
jgi:hypothetical protein